MAEVKVGIDPADAGFDTERLTRIDRHFARYVDDGRLPGWLIAVARDGAIAEGITINGLPILLNRPNVGQMDLVNLDEYYEDCVIGGPGAFMIPIRERSQFVAATRTKLILEIAELTSTARVQRVQARQPRVSCTVGEQMWRDRWGN